MTYEMYVGEQLSVPLILSSLAIATSQAIEASFTGVPDACMTDAMAPSVREGELIRIRAKAAVAERAAMEKARAGKY